MRSSWARSARRSRWDEHSVDRVRRRLASCAVTTAWLPDPRYRRSSPGALRARSWRSCPCPTGAGIKNVAYSTTQQAPPIRAHLLHRCRNGALAGSVCGRPSRTTITSRRDRIAPQSCVAEPGQASTQRPSSRLSGWGRTDGSRGPDRGRTPARPAGDQPERWTSITRYGLKTRNACGSSLPWRRTRRASFRTWP